MPYVEQIARNRTRRSAPAPLIASLCLFLALCISPLNVLAAPVVVTPGEASGYLYFPAGVTTTGEGGTTSGLVGMIAAFSKPPSDEWLICDGSTILAADYPDLVKHLRGGPGHPDAQLPDYRGYFLRGWDGMGGTPAGVDAGRALNNVQGDENRAHSHTGGVDPTPTGTAGTTNPDGVHSHTWTMAYSFGGSGGVTLESGSYQGSYTQTTTASGAHAHTFTLPSHAHALTINSSGGVETRPKNVSVIYAIRAK